MATQDPNERRDSLFPLIEFITYVSTSVLVIAMVVGRAVSGGTWPGLTKLTAILGVSLVVWIYGRLKGTPDREDVRRLSHMALSARQCLYLILFIMVWSSLVGWVVVGPR